MSTASADVVEATSLRLTLWRYITSGLAGVSYDLLKRVCDLAIAIPVLIVLLPVFFVVAVLIKLTDFGPVLYVQTRIGKDGVPFSCLKFRSMKVNADRMKAQIMASSHHRDQRSFKMAKDPRVTWIGRFIRKFSIDEFPQLWNVIRGEMSLVGPRPSCPREVALYERSDWERLRVKPGLTCIWQVCGRGDIPFDQQLLMDVEYVESRCLWLDFKLLLMTIPAVLAGKGAY